MNILSIDTSADETSAAITNERKVLSNVVYSQVLIHKNWGGVVPSLAKRAHEERIDWVVQECLRKGRYEMNDIDAVAVTQGPGLAIALEVGIKKAKELCRSFNKKLIGVNHLEGHIYSSFVQNSMGNPPRQILFPLLGIIVSGGHTEIVRMNNHLQYEILGSTVDDAAGEAIDKAAKMFGFGYPGGPIIERLAMQEKNKEYYRFPRPMIKTDSCMLSFSGLKTSLFYFLQKMSEKEKNVHIQKIASSYQEAVFDCIIQKTKKAIKQTNIIRLVVGGGVSANKRLRNLFRRLVRENQGTVHFPPYPYLTGDNAAMIGIVAYYKLREGRFCCDLNLFDRIPRFTLANCNKN